MLDDILAVAGEEPVVQVVTDLLGNEPFGGVTALDPEELREVLHEYQTVCAAAIERYGGLVVRQVGDGLLVNFGFPQAHEDDAARAVRAGLAIVSALFSTTLVLFPHYQQIAAERLGLKTQWLVWWVVAQNMGTALFSLITGPIADILH